MQRPHLCAMLLLSATFAAAEAAHGQGPSIKLGTGAIEFYLGGDLVTRYLHGPKLAKPIFWPVLSPTGSPLTRAWPLEKAKEGESTDHPHQKSVWFCHGDVIPEGLKLDFRLPGVAGVDFWSEAPGHGRIVCTKVDEPRREKDHAWVRTANEWSTADGRKVLDESRTLHLHDLGSSRLLVLDIDLNASVCALTFGDTKEGSMGVRINDALRAGKGGKGKIEIADRKVGEEACWGQTSAWCDYSGPIEGREVGLALLADPKNAHPSCFHVRAYGLMAANPFGRAKSKFPGAAGRSELVRLDQGAHLHLRYGLLLHTGDSGRGAVAQGYGRFVELRDREAPSK